MLEKYVDPKYWEKGRQMYFLILEYFIDSALEFVSSCFGVY